MKRKCEPIGELLFEGRLFQDDAMYDLRALELCDILTEGMDTSQCVSVPENSRPSAPTEADVLNIYNDLSKLADIERYLNVLYRPFTCFLDTKCRYNLASLQHLMPNSSYEPGKHAALTMTHVLPRGSAKIYTNGTIYCQAFNRRSALRVMSKISSALAEVCGYNPSLRQPKFNLVNATFCMPFALDLPALHQRNKPFTVYSPKKQPFVTYRLPRTMIKFAIFPVGYVYVMFCTRPKDIQFAIGHILAILYPCRATEQPNPSDLELCRGDISYKLLWEREFQREDDFCIKLEHKNKPLKLKL